MDFYFILKPAKLYVDILAIFLKNGLIVLVSASAVVYHLKCLNYLCVNTQLRKSSHALFYIFLLIFCISDSSPFPSSVPHTFQINFNSLYTTLCEQQTSDQATLLLYTLLHQNANVRTYMLARTDMENLVSIERNLSCVSATSRSDLLRSDLLSFPGGSGRTAGGRSGGAGEPEGR